MRMPGSHCFLLVLFCAVLAQAGALPPHEDRSGSASGAAAAPPPGDEFNERFERVDKHDTAALFELAQWCSEKKRKKEYRVVCSMILEIEPDHEGANVGLGRVRYGGEWMTPEKRSELIAERRAARMRALGLVEYKGAWVTPAEKDMLEKGFVRHEGRWMTPAEARAARGFVQEGGRWINAADLPLVREMDRFEKEQGVVTAYTSSDHFAVFSEFGEDYNQKLIRVLEKGFDWFEELFGTQKIETLSGGRKVLVALFNERKAFDAHVTFFSAFQENMSENWTRKARGVLGFAWWDPTCYSVAYLGPRDEVQATGQILHQTGRVLLNRRGYNYHFLPPWLDEAFASLFEYTVTGQIWASSIQGRNLVSSVGDDDLFSGEGWRGLLSTLVARGIDPPFEELMTKEMDMMDEDDVAKAIGLVKFLADQGDGRLDRFVDHIQSRLPKDDAIAWNDPHAVQVQLEAIEIALGVTPEEADLAFRTAWTKASSPPPDDRKTPGKQESP